MMVQKYLGLQQAAMQADNGSFTAVSGATTNITGFNTIFDTANGFNPSTGVYVTPYAGTYLVVAQFTFTTISPAVGNTYQLILAKNGVAYTPGTAIFPICNVGQGVIACTLHQLVPMGAGNSLQVQLLQNTGSTQGVAGGAQASWLSIMLMAPYPTLPD